MMRSMHKRKTGRFSIARDVPVERLIEARHLKGSDEAEEPQDRQHPEAGVETDLPPPMGEA